MKKFIHHIFIIAVFAACNNKPSAPLQSDMVVLTPGKAINVYSDAMPAALDIQKPAITLRKTEGMRFVTYTPKRSPKEKGYSSQPEVPIIISPDIEEAIATPAVTQPPVIDTNNSNDVASKTATDSTETEITTNTPLPVKKEKRGLSNATKGAVIGGVGGAIGGAIFSKNKSKGAIIGGVIGAAGGYIFGKTRDEKQAQNNNQFTHSNN